MFRDFETFAVAIHRTHIAIKIMAKIFYEYGQICSVIQNELFC